MTGWRFGREGSAMITQGTILVVEDDVAIAALLIEVLAEEGYVVQIAASGADALAALQADQLDLALLDLNLPSLSGWELLETVRAQQLDVPVVIMTASTPAADELAAAGAHACLLKPFDLDDLLACVSAHIRRSGPGALAKGERSMHLLRHLCGQLLERGAGLHGVLPADLDRQRRRLCDRSRALPALRRASARHGYA
jgi:DNA-binding response OmpR family regulator